MKSLFAGIFVLGLSVLFGGCQSDWEVNGPNAPSSGLISAQINGQFWSASDGYMETVPPFGIRIRGVQGQQSEMLISISPYHGPRTYMLDGITTIEYSSGTDLFQAINGQVTIHSHGEDWLEGEFHGEFVSQTTSLLLNVTEGQFQIPLY